MGIDEAGYGPLLGPLCVATSVFHMEEATEPQDLWELLSSAVCRSPKDSKGRVAIDDSKRLKGSNQLTTRHPLTWLERGVLAALSSMDGGELPGSDSILLERLGAKPPSECPWWAGEAALPLANDAGLLGIAASRLARTQRERALRLHRLRCMAIDAPELNRRMGPGASKAAVNSWAAMTLLDQALRDAPNSTVHAFLDRHGGRIHYREELSFCFPDAAIRVLEESEATSRYELRWGARTAHVAWQVGGETHHLPVALASMTAKLVRELWMARLNRHVARVLPEVKPTAGYVEDGRRWLAEVEPHLGRLGVSREQLVRQA